MVKNTAQLINCSMPVYAHSRIIAVYIMKWHIPMMNPSVKRIADEATCTVYFGITDFLAFILSHSIIKMEMAVVRPFVIVSSFINHLLHTA